MVADRKKQKPRWDADKVRALRKHMGATQQELADRLGSRQQTVSEWETGLYQPRGPSATLLTMIAEEAGFTYDVSPQDVP